MGASTATRSCRRAARRTGAPRCRFDDHQLRAGLRFFLMPGARGRLAAEIRAQFEAFRATASPSITSTRISICHLHPRVARWSWRSPRLRDARRSACRLSRLTPCARPFPANAFPPGAAFRVAALRRRLRHAGVAMNDQVFGIAWSGAMVEERILACCHICRPGSASSIATRRRSAARLGRRDARLRNPEELPRAQPRVPRRITVHRASNR